MISAMSTGDQEPTCSSSLCPVSVISAMSTRDQEPTCSSSLCPVSVTHTAADIPGATLSEPLRVPCCTRIEMVVTL